MTQLQKEIRKTIHDCALALCEIEAALMRLPPRRPANDNRRSK